MCRSSRKNEYIEYLLAGSKSQDKESYRVNLTNIFTNLESKVEEFYDKDICELSSIQAKAGLSLIGASSYSYLTNLIRLLSKYTDWCIEKGYHTGENVYQSLSYSDLELSSVKLNSLLGGYEHMCSYLDDLCGKLEPAHKYNVYRTVMWLYYFGVNFEEAQELTANDYKDGLLTVGNKVIDMSPYEEVRKCIETTINQSYFWCGKRTLSYPPQSYILKRMSFKSNFKRTVWTRISNLRAEYTDNTGNNTYSLTDIEKSGLFWRMKICANEDDRNVILTEFIYKKYTNDDSKSKRRFMYKEILSDYKRWEDTYY